MADRDRHEKIVNLVGERGFQSVRELSEQLDVSEMTIRRDLSRLEQQGRLKKTYGGAASTRSVGAAAEGIEPLSDQKAEGPLVDTIDVLIATSVNPLYDALLLDRVRKRRISVIAESVELPEGKTVVAVDNCEGQPRSGAVGGTRTTAARARQSAPARSVVSSAQHADAQSRLLGRLA